MKCILVATDGSESASRAVDSATQLAKRFDAILLIVNAVDHNTLSTDEMNKFRQAEGISLGDALAALSSRILTQAKDLAKTQNFASVQTESREGDAAQAVLEIVRERGADAIVVGRRGCSQLRGLLLGSISQKLVTLAPCPVVVVP